MKSELLLPAIALAASFLAPFSASAQSAGNDVSMKIDFVAWGETISGLSLKSASSDSTITALSFRYSKPVSYSGPAVMEIHQKSGSGSPQAAAGVDAATGIPQALAERRKKEPTLVSLVPLPAGASHVTVLLAPAAGGTYQPYVINDDPSKLPLGRLRIHNLSPYPIAMRCNNKTGGELKTKGSMLVQPQNREVIYELAYQNEGEWVMQENNITTVNDDEQAQLVVLKSDANFFTSQDGSTSGFLQTVVLRRSKSAMGDMPELAEGEKKALLDRMNREEERMAKEAAEAAKPKAPKKK